MPDVNDTNDLAQQMAELRAQMDEVRDGAAELESLEASFKQEKANAQEEYSRKIAAINDRAKITDAHMRMAKNKLRDLQVQFESAERQYSQARTIAELEDEYKTLEDRWDLLTINAKWKQEAKPHQDSGAKRLAYMRRINLNDTVGLGKTLTAGVAAIDIIKAMTIEGDTWSEQMAYQDYHDKTDEVSCRRNGCREQPNGQMYGKCEIVHHDPPAGRRILYVCPAALLKNVEAEYKRWSGNTDGSNERETVILGKTTKIERRFIIDKVLNKPGLEYVVIVNYEAWRKDSQLVDDLVELKFDTIIIDEAHNIKDRKSIGYRGVRALIDGFSMPRQSNKMISEKIGEPIRFVFPMTGTPILNRPQELYTMLTLVDSKTFTNTTEGERRFMGDYCVQEYDDNGTLRWTFKPGGIDALLSKFGNRILRRDRKSAGIVLPPQEVQYHNLDINEEMYPEQCEARVTMRKFGMIITDPERNRGVVAQAEIAVRTRLRQIETWPDGIELKDPETGEIILRVNIEQSQKLDYVIQYNHETGDFDGLLPEICPLERTVLFTQFDKAAREIGRRASKAGYRVAYVRGGQTEKERNEIRIDCDRYHDGIENYAYKYDLVICNYKAGGVGLNFNDFTQIIGFDDEWNPGKRDQAWGRTDRMGQTEEQTVHVIRMTNTVDSWMVGLIEYKEAMVGGFESAAVNMSLHDALKAGEV